jgi:hypothetical protein
MALPVQADPARPDLTHKQEQQKLVQADTDQTVRRVSTMLRVLDYYQLDKRGERQLLDEVAGTLAGLSRAQMNEVIARLEAAAKAADEKQVRSHTEGAYVRHREIVAQLKALLARYDAVKSLDQAAGRLEQTAKKQHELSLRGSQMAQQWRKSSALTPQAQKTRQDLQQEIRHAHDDQTDLKKEAAAVLTQLEKLREQLPAEQQQRLSQAMEAARKQQVLERMDRAAEALAPTARDCADELKASVAAQRQAAEGLQELSRTLRTPLDRLSALREARDRVERVMANQEGLRRQAENAAHQPPSKEKEQRAREMGDQQARLEHDTRSARSLLTPQDRDLARQIAPAEQSMRQAEETLRNQAPQHATKPQSEAAQTLRKALQDLDRRIAEAEKERGDPLAALQKAGEKIDRLLQEQKDLRDKAAEATSAQKMQRLPAMTGKQQELGKQTEQLSQETPSSQPQALAALEKAAEAMEKASKDLQEKKGKESVSRQDEAISKLEKARKDIAQQAAEIEKRRQEIAALEKAAERLDQLTKDQGKLTKAAQACAENSEGKDTRDLAKKQGDLQPQAKEVGQQLEQAAPEAAKKVAQAGEKVEAARENLDKSQPKPGAKEAKAATDRLKEAQKAVAQALDEKRGADLAEQAALQPDNDAANAADQIAKALEQTNQAAEQSEQAANHLGSKPKTPDLAKLQKQVAEQAGKVKAEEAGKPAHEAADALHKGDLKAAIAQQQKALAQLEKKAAERGEAKEAGSEKGMPHPAEAKNAGELAQAQKGLLEATQALARSQEATQEAQAALAQAQAQAPQGVQDKLQQADAELNKAAEQLHQGEPHPANQSQQAAAAQLSSALEAMNAALAAMGQKPGSSSKPSQARAMGQKPGQSKSQAQAKSPGQGKSRAPAQEKNGNKGTGDRVADGKMSGGASELRNVTGSGSFLHLPPRQREMIRQALTEKLPAQYAAMIQQYYVNIAGGKPAAPPAKPARPSTPGGR